MIFKIAIVFILAFIVSDGSHYYFSQNPNLESDSENNDGI